MCKFFGIMKVFICAVLHILLYFVVEKDSGWEKNCRGRGQGRAQFYSRKAANEGETQNYTADVAVPLFSKLTSGGQISGVNCMGDSEQVTDDGQYHLMGNRNQMDMSDVCTGYPLDSKEYGCTGTGIEGGSKQAAVSKQDLIPPCRLFQRTLQTTFRGNMVSDASCETAAMTLRSASQTDDNQRNKRFKLSAQSSYQSAGISERGASSASTDVGKQFANDAGKKSSAAAFVDRSENKEQRTREQENATLRQDSVNVTDTKHVQSHCEKTEQCQQTVSPGSAVEVTEVNKVMRKSSKAHGDAVPPVGENRYNLRSSQHYSEETFSSSYQPSPKKSCVTAKHGSKKKSAVNDIRLHETVKKWSSENKGDECELFKSAETGSKYRSTSHRGRMAAREEAGKEVNFCQKNVSQTSQKLLSSDPDEKPSNETVGVRSGRGRRQKSRHAAESQHQVVRGNNPSFEYSMHVSAGYDFSDSNWREKGSADQIRCFRATRSGGAQAYRQTRGSRPAKPASYCYPRATEHLAKTGVGAVEYSRIKNGSREVCASEDWEADLCVIPSLSRNTTDSLACTVEETYVGEAFELSDYNSLGAGAVAVGNIASVTNTTQQLPMSTPKSVVEVTDDQLQRAVTSENHNNNHNSSLPSDMKMDLDGRHEQTESEVYDGFINKSSVQVDEASISSLSLEDNPQVYVERDSSILGCSAPAVNSDVHTMNTCDDNASGDGERKVSVAVTSCDLAFSTVLSDSPRLHEDSDELVGPYEIEANDEQMSCPQSENFADETTTGNHSYFITV